MGHPSQTRRRAWATSSCRHAVDHYSRLAYSEGHTTNPRPPCSGNGPSVLRGAPYRGAGNVCRRRFPAIAHPVSPRSSVRTSNTPLSANRPTGRSSASIAPWLPSGTSALHHEFCLAAPGIVAVGDVASWHHPSYGRRMRLQHQTNALEQGSVAARTLIVSRVRHSLGIFGEGIEDPVGGLVPDERLSGRRSRS